MFDCNFVFEFVSIVRFSQESNKGEVLILNIRRKNIVFSYD